MKPLWGQVVWARQLGMRNSSVLNLVLRGKRHPSAQMTMSLLKYLEFQPHEADHFVKLVGSQKIRSSAGSRELNVTLESSSPEDTKH